MSLRVHVRIALLGMAFVTSASVTQAATYNWNGSSGDWDTTTANWTGAGTIWTNTGTDNDAVFGGSAGTVTLTTGISASDLTFNTTGYTVQSNTLTLNGTTPTVSAGAGISASINSIIAGSAGLAKTGTGTVTLGGVNTYSGGTAVSGGTLKLDLAARSGAQNLGIFVVGSSGTLELYNTNTAVDNILLTGSTWLAGTGTITKTGAGYIGLWADSDTIKNFTGLVDVQAGILGSNDNGWQNSAGMMDLNVASGASFDMRTQNVKVNKLTGTGTIYGTYVQSQTLIVGNNNGNATFSGTITNGAGGGNNSLTKVGAGTQTLSGASTYTGATTIAGGTLALDFSAAGAPTTNILNSTVNNSALSLGGGTLSLTGKANTSNSQRFPSLTLTPGSSSVVLNADPTSNPLLLTVLGITRNTGGAVDFTLPTGVQSGTNGITTSTTNNATGILGAWATVDGADWATNSTNAVGGNIIAYSAYADVTRLSSGTKVIADGSTTNVRIVEGTGSAADVTLGAATTTINTLNQSTSGGSSAATIDPAGQTLVVNGILVGTGSGGLTIGNGTNNGTVMTATSGGELVLINHASNAITVNSGIADNTSASSLTKGGTGLLTLANTTNTYTGKTYLGGGITNIVADASLGTAPGSTVADQLTFSGGTLQLNSAFNLATTRGLTINAGGGTIDTQGFDSTYAGVIANTTGALTKTGAGKLTLSGSNSYTGQTVVSQGTLTLVQNNAFNSFVTIASGATLEMNATAQLNNVATPTFTGTGTLLKTGNFQWYLDAGGSNQAYLNMSPGGLIHIAEGSIYQGGVVTRKVTTNQGSMQVATGAVFDLYSDHAQVDALTGGGTVQNTYGPGGLKNFTVGVANGTGTFTGTIGGGSLLALIKTGSGTQTLTGNNNYSGGTTVNAGTLILNGGTTFDAGIVHGTATVNNGATLQIKGNSSNIWPIASGDTVNVNGGGTLSIIGGTTQDSASTVGTINLNSTNGSAAVVSTSDNSAIRFAQSNNGFLTSTGAVANTFGAGIELVKIGAGNTFTVTAASGNTLNITGIIKDYTTLPGTPIVVNGTGTVVLSGVNTYSGSTTVSAGTLKLDMAARSSAVQFGAISVATGATLELYNTNTTVDNVLVTGTTNITGSGTVTKTGAGYIGLWNDTDTIKDFTGLVDVQVGTLGSNGNGWQNSAGLMDLNVASAAFFDMRTQNVKINRLTGSGTIYSSFSAPTLILGNNNGSASFSGTITNGLGLTKSGAGTQILTGANTYTGSTSITGGTLLVNNSTGSGVGTGDLVINGGTLGGSGFLGLAGNAANVTFGASGGTISPGTSPGMLTVNGGVDFTTAGIANFAVELNGLVAGTGYDQLVVNAAAGSTNLIDLDNATLLVTLGFTPAIGNQFTIIDNTITSGGLTGIFSGLTNNSTFLVGATLLRINYDAGTGNDVVLTVVPEPNSFAILLVGGVILWLVGRKRIV